MANTSNSEYTVASISDIQESMPKIRFEDESGSITEGRVVSCHTNNITVSDGNNEWLFMTDNNNKWQLLSGTKMVKGNLLIKKPIDDNSQKSYIPFNPDEWELYKEHYKGNVFQKDNLNTPVDVYLLTTGDIVFGKEYFNMALISREEAEKQLVVKIVKKKKVKDTNYNNFR